MMQKQKIVQRSLLAAAAAISFVLAPTVVKAADGSLGAAGLATVKVDGKNAQLKVTATDSAVQEILVGTGRANVKKQTITVSTWDVYDGNDVTVDLSKLKNTTDNYLVLGTNKTKDVSIIKIPAKGKVTKVKYDAANVALQAGYGTTSKEATANTKLLKAEEDAKNVYEYRTAYSGWTDMGEKGLPQLDLYQQNGSQLYVRLKGEAEGPVQSSAEGTAKEELKYNGQEDLLPVFVAPSLPGKEVKVTITAKAKGPTITADYTSGTVKIPKNTEYRLVTNASILKPAGTAKQDAAASVTESYFTKYADGQAHSVSLLFEEAGAPNTVDSAALEVRKTKTEKKAPSKWYRLTIQPLKDLEGVTPGENKDSLKGEGNGTLPPANATAKYEGQGIAGAVVKEESTGSNVLAIKYIPKTSKTKTTYTIEITNSGKNNYEVYVAKKGDTTNPANITGRLSVTKVSAGKKGTLKPKNDDDLSWVWIRKAGDKKLKNWASNWVKLGVIDLPYDVPTTQTDQKDQK